MQNMKLFLLASRRRRDRQLIIKMFDVLNGQISQLIFPDDHPCSRVRGSGKHTNPRFHKNQMVFSCMDRRNGKYLNSVFNITWTHRHGILSVRQSWYTPIPYMLFFVQNGEIIQLGVSRRTVFSIRYIFPQLKQNTFKSFQSAFGPDGSVFQMNYYQKLSWFLLVFRDLVNARPFALTMIQLLCQPSNPWNNEFKYYERIKVFINWRIQPTRGKHAFETLVLMHNNGDILSPIPSFKSTKKGIKRTFWYLKIFTIVDY
jgi:hypothetical protein